MGTVIGAPAWLLDLAKQSPRHAQVATRIMQTAIATERRTGHALDLDHHQVRAGIVHSAKWGHVSRVPARCLHCNATAPLTDWDAVAHASVEDHRALSASAAYSHRPHDYLYIQRCPGAEIAAALAASNHLPAER